MGSLLRSARSVLFVDRFFDIRDARYKETLKSCLETLAAAAANGAHCETHCCDHESRPPADMVQRDAGRWPRGGSAPRGTSLLIHPIWPGGERDRGADFHARYLLTDVGGMNVEAGFSAEGAHQKVQLGLLSLDFAQSLRAS